MSTAPLGELRRSLSRSLPRSLFAVALLLACALPARAQASRESGANASGNLTPPYAPQLKLAAPAVAPPARTATAYPGAPAPDPVQRLQDRVAPRSYPPKAGEPGPTPPLPACGVISDCSFEVGGGWAGTDVAAALLTLGIYPAGINQGYGFFSLAPTDGALCLATGFDGAGPGDITAFQDVILEPKADRLVFDFRAGWDLVNYVATSTLPREFFVEIEPFGGGPVLSSATVLTVPPLTFNFDTGNITSAVSVAAFAGQPVRVKFRWHVPEVHTGPAVCQVDHVRVLENDCGVVSNCSFETGAFPNWIPLDMATPFLPIGIHPAGTSTGYGLFASAPTDGLLSILTGFDGGGPADSKLVQDVTLPSDAFSLDFDWRAGWDMQLVTTSTQPREFFVEVEPSGGGAALQSTRLLYAPAATKLLDTGARKGLVDISKFAGSAVRLVFRWHIPEPFTGPGQFQLDHVQVTREPCASIADCSYEAGGVPWTLTDAAPPFIPMHVGGAGEVNGFGSFATAPTNGNLALIHGFDGAGPTAISAVQDVKLPLWADQLRFDYRAAWDMLTFGGSTRPRLFVVEVQPSGGGPALASDVALVAPPHTQLGDTGPRSRTLPVGAFAGQDVRIVFRWDIPENFTGPGFFQLDHVTLGSNPLDAGPGGANQRTLSLSPAAPNPSRGAATFRFTLPAVSDVQLEVVDVHGARVWSDRRTALAAGEHQIAWNGVKSGGGLAPAGVYYARVRTPDGTRSRMFVRVR